MMIDFLLHFAFTIKRKISEERSLMIARFLTNCMLVLLVLIEIAVLTSLYHTLAYGAPEETFSPTKQCPGGRSTPT